MKMKVEHAYRRSIETVVHWIHNEVNTNKTQVFFRTFAPVHFRGGDWRTGGIKLSLRNCQSWPGSSLVPPETWDQLKLVTHQLVTDVLSNHMNTTWKFSILNVTYMTAQRKDGHSSLYYLGPIESPAPLHRQDCSHWCLPRVPDSWNKLLYALFLKRKTTTYGLNSSTQRAQI
ncbi:hypothetical protein EZV62_000556 [Acer yangbiense]|uniref:Trichome birefringence-like C-terminal domain-containing protein n=1 Tax=Acer yangbiense TaxID=1000413 RepID=A0A5C7IRF7_9ROSI|nr:hypothetical protein EZV62_000556 [Acer yangbiense]